MPRQNIKIIFMGTPQFALSSLESLINSTDIEVLAVVTQEDKKVGRHQILTPPLVKKMALDNGIPVFQPETLKNNRDFIKLLKKLEPDFIVAVAYGKILPKEILEIPRFGCINIHPSLLPKYRGATPVQEALLHADHETGVTIMEMEEKMDSGKIYLVKKIPIESNDDVQTLSAKLFLLGGVNLPFVLREIKENGLMGIPQNEKNASYCKKMTKDDGLVDLFSFTAEEILNRVKAYNPWPSCYLIVNGRRLKILEAEIDLKKDFQPGKVLEISKGSIALGTKKGLLIPKKVQLEGKASMLIDVFLRGNAEFFSASSR